MQDISPYNQFAANMLHNDSKYIPGWFGAIGFNTDRQIVLNDSKCLGCGQCAVACPEQAIEMSASRGEDFIPE